MRRQFDREPDQLELFERERPSARRVHGRAGSQLDDWREWYVGLPPPRLRLIQAAAGVLGIVLFGSSLLAIWHAAVSSEMNRALAREADARGVREPVPPLTREPSALPAPAVRAPAVPAPAVPAPAAPPPVGAEPAVPAPVATPPQRPAPVVPVAPALAPAQPAAPAVVVATPQPAATPPVRSSARPPAPTRHQAPRATPARPAPPAVMASRPVVPPPVVTAAAPPPVIESRPVPTATPAAPADVLPAPLATAAPAAPRTSAVAVPDALSAERSAVNAVLAAYRRSYNALDAASAAAIWQGVDAGALRRAFEGLSRQNLAFDRCDVRVRAADRAVARCDGVLSYVPKVGDGLAQERHLTWTINLQRATDRWLISDVEAR